jgi:hypothetical protein
LLSLFITKIKKIKKEDKSIASADVPSAKPMRA